MTTDGDIAAILRRLDAAERNQSDHARILTAYNEEIKHAKDRIAALEEHRQERRVIDAGDAERGKALVADVASMKADISSIKGTFAKALWIFVSAIIVAFATFLIRGGLAP